MLQKDWDELREFIKTIKDEYTQGEFNFDSESPFEVRGVKAVTLFRDECYWRPESEDAWAGILMRFLNGEKENDYDDGQRPYKITNFAEKAPAFRHGDESARQTWHFGKTLLQNDEVSCIIVASLDSPKESGCAGDEKETA